MRGDLATCPHGNSASHGRRSFATVEEVTARLIARLHEHGAAEALDLDGALMCHALDVIGKASRPLMQLACGHAVRNG